MSEAKISDPFRTPGEQAEPRVVGLCETCTHVDKGNPKSEFWKCTHSVRAKPAEPGLEFVSSEVHGPKLTTPGWCTVLRSECGAVCPNYEENE